MRKGGMVGGGQQFSYSRGTGRDPRPAAVSKRDQWARQLLTRYVESVFSGRADASLWSGLRTAGITIDRQDVQDLRDEMQAELGAKTSRAYGDMGTSQDEFSRNTKFQISQAEKRIAGLRSSPYSPSIRRSFLHETKTLAMLKGKLETGPAVVEGLAKASGETELTKIVERLWNQYSF